MIAARSAGRPIRWFVGVSAMVLVALSAPAAAQAKDVPMPIPSNSGLPDSGNGAVTAADRDFVIRVRLAGLWEIPASNMAATKSKNKKIQAIGRAIGPQHVTLDHMDIDVAKKLGIEIPSTPNADQQGWLDEMAAANSTTFDQIYIDRLRAAHGKIFPAIATIRAGSRNDSVRKLAQETNQFVMTHMTLLESSGIVNYGALPTLPPPVAQKGPVPVDGQMLAAASSGDVSGVKTPVILMVLAAALVAGVVTTMRIFRTR
jgi:putative membrane protein